MAPLISIVLPCSGEHAAELGKCLASLRHQDFAGPYEILVVNSHDSPAVAEVAREHGAGLVAGQGSTTAGAARNSGVSASHAEILAFIDADCVAEPTWLSALHASLIGDVVAVGGPVLNQLPFHPIAVIDNLMQFVDQAPGRGNEAARELPGCNLAIRRWAFGAAGGFPANIYPGEDTVLTQRVSRRYPGRVLFDPTMRILHRGRTSFSGFWRHQWSFGYARGRYALNISERQQRLGRHMLIAGVAGLRRAAYLFRRTAQWNGKFLPRVILFSPLLLFGLAAWGLGFNRGCLAPVDRAESAASSDR